MEPTTASDVEILVHITAPSTAADDVRYRHLASAYLDFRPWRATKITKDPPLPSSQGPKSPLQSTSEIIEDSFIEPASQDGSMQGLCAPYPPLASHALSSPRCDVIEDSFIEPASQDGSMQGLYAPYTPLTRLVSSSPIRSGVIDDSFVASSLPSNPFGGNSAAVSSRRNEQDDDGWPDSSAAIPSSRSQRGPGGDDGDGDDDDDDIVVEVPDSYPTATATMSKFCTPTRVFEHFYQRMQPSTPAERPTKRHRADAEPPAHARDSRNGGRSQGGTGPPEPPTAQQTQERQTAGHLPPASIRRHQSDQGQPRPKRLIPPPRSMSETVAKPINPLHRPGNSLEITPPQPPVSVDSLDAASLVTPRLASLARNLELDKRYRPDYACPDLRPLDRGYWLVDCSAWSEDLRGQAWAYLSNYVGSGCAGWGVWCRRAGAQGQPGPEGGDAVVGAWMRTYCWAAVAGHVYLLLHLASQRKLKLADVSWIGADGEVKILVSARGDVDRSMSIS